MPGETRLYEQERRRATTPGAVITPGSNFDASEVDRYLCLYCLSKPIFNLIILLSSEDFLRSQLMRSASDEALCLKSDDLEDDVDSLRSPFYKPRTSLRGYPLESPQSPPSEDSSYQGSIPGSGPSDRSYNGGGGGSGGSATGPGRPTGGAGVSAEADLETVGYYYKH